MSTVSSTTRSRGSPVNKYLLIGGASLLSLAVGAVAGYSYAEHKLMKDADEVLEKQISAVRNYYSTLYKQGEFSTPEKAVETLGRSSVDVVSQGQDLAEAADLLRGYQGYYPATEQNANGDAAEIYKSVFDRAPVGGVDFDFSDEVAARTPDKPYIIAVPEFMANDPNHQQVTVTYYEGDHVLADDRDAVVDEFEAAIGLENLRFGHRSDDNNVVYVRNERHEVDFEILRSTGRYAHEVLGHGEHE